MDGENYDKQAGVGVDGKKSGNPGRTPIQKKNQLKNKNGRQKDDYLGFNDPRGRSALQRRGLNRKKETKSKRESNEKRTSFIRAANMNKTYLFDKKRDKEFMRHFNESDDDEPDWDPRLRAVKKKFGEITIRKKREARKAWHEIEEAKSDSDSNDKGSSDSDSRLRALEIETSNKGIEAKGDEGNNNVLNPKGDTESKGTWDGSDEDTRSEGSDFLDSKRQAKYNKDNQESDEDPWFWDSKGWDSKGSDLHKKGDMSKRDKDGNTNQCSNGGNSGQNHLKDKTPNLKNTGSRLKKSIEKVQLEAFRRKYYENLINGNRVADASSISSRSSTSSESSLSSIEHSIKAPEGLKGTANKFLDDSDEDDNEVITYTKRGWTIRRAPRMQFNKCPKEARRLHWSDESSVSSRSTLSSDESSSGQNGAATQ